ncbi:hypothetical protein DEH81_20470 [Pectobacterium zantedeschiae]|uniref:Uncharacterized protein n=1 Tax=Pectobacterium zantedeschiae TaxID=2034769 RepID=A0A9X8JF90_9GAMM|nr:hypothetical protein DEH81_20470 [Pectobacterium zantedeschiae]RYC39169.1 hypothetical protein CTN06_16490 [Pectobacterium zantedeschiae]RYC39555.1 hypothetical protein CLR69_20945 [Pectobacterium zantedeschiae]
MVISIWISVWLAIIPVTDNKGGFICLEMQQVSVKRKAQPSDAGAFLLPNFLLDSAALPLYLCT